MDEPIATPVCQACGTALAVHDDLRGQLCLGCLLEPGLDQTRAQARSSADTLEGLRCADDGVKAGTRFAHYEINAGAATASIELGRGAMGVTYRAIDTVLRHTVALKVIDLDLAAHPRAHARFLREAQTAAGLRHPHIASVYFFGERPENGQPFYTMELVEGETLQARVSRCGGLPADAVLEIGSQVAAALAAAEARGLTHRDLKPANLMLMEGAGINVKVIDFGLARAASEADSIDPKLTHQAEFVGTPAFASPEQFERGADIGPRSDFYALGATLWYALTGRAPFAGRTPDEIHDRQLHQPLALGPLHAARVPRTVLELLTSLLSTDPAGRPQTTSDLMAAIMRCREQIATPTPPVRRWFAISAVATSVLLLACATIWTFYGHARSKPVPSTPVPDKSIAVLPFDNLSADQANAFFADGVQDAILTDLAHVADLKVISRNSVTGYRNPAKRPPTREIGRALGVAYLLEGSVQREGGRVRVNAQLIDAATDRHVWAQGFDRDVTDIFAIQSEIAHQITGQLQAKLSREETAVLDAPPTRDLMAYELFLHARQIIRDFDVNRDKWEPVYEAVRLLEEATIRDPDFLEAWCMLAAEHDDLIWYKADATPARLAQAQAALDAARRIAPDSGETHLALAGHYYKLHDPAHGHPELALARAKLPNDVRVFFLTGTTSMVEGHWTEALSALEKSSTLSPRQLTAHNNLVGAYLKLRRYDDSRRTAEDAIAVGIGVDYFPFRIAAIVWDQTADTTRLHEYFRRLDAGGAPSERTTAVRIQTAWCDRDFDEAVRVLAADPRREFQMGDRRFVPRSYLEAQNARMRGDLTAARPLYEASRPALEETVRRLSEDPAALMQLAQLDANLGRREDALSEARQAVDLRPISRDALEGPTLVAEFAEVLTMLGQKDRAISLLERLVNVPGSYDYGYMRSLPTWDPLRGNPRFEAVLQALRAPVDLTKFHPEEFAPSPSPTSKP